MTTKAIANDKINSRLVSRNLSIVELNLLGKSQRQIGKLKGLSQQQISNILDDKELRQLTDSAITREVLGLEKCGRKLDSLIDSKDEKVSLHAIGMRQANTGISGTRTPNVKIQQIYVDNRTIAPEAHQTMIDLLELKRNNDLKLGDNGVIDVTST